MQQHISFRFTDLLENKINIAKPNSLKIMYKWTQFVAALIGVHFGSHSHSPWKRVCGKHIQKPKTVK